MRVIHAHSNISASHGGIVAALADFLPALEARGVHCDMVALEARGELRSQSPLDSPRLNLASGKGPESIGFAPDLYKLFDSLARQADVIHSHGQWRYLDFVSARIAHKRNLPHIISIHGMMDPYAWSRSRRRKDIAEKLFQNRALRNARAIHALVPKEAEDIRNLGWRNPIALIPNGVDLNSVEALPPRSVFEQILPAVKDKKILLFLGRLHPKKGLLHFLPAWKRVMQQPNAKDWHFVIAGPDEGGHRTELEELVASLGLESSVSFVGLLQGEAKRAALGAASAFVLPSHSEGFSMSLLEAMGARLPLLITPACNFPEAVQANAALLHDATEEAAVEGLEELFALSSSDIQKMGCNGRALVERDYTWESAAQKMEAVYFWARGQAERPKWVIN